MVLCHINLNLEYAQLHNKTAGNNHVLHIVTFLFKLRYCISNTVYVISTLSAPYYNPNIFDPVNMFVFNKPRLANMHSGYLNYIKL